MSFGAEQDDKHAAVQRECSTAFELMERKEWAQALAHLETVAELLPLLEPGSHLRLLVHQNSACCYQQYPPHRTHDLSSAASSLRDYIRSLILPPLKSQSEATLGERISRKRGLGRTHIQICALLSQIGDHKQALVHAKEAGRVMHTCIEDSLTLCHRHIAQFKAALSTAGSESEFRQSKYATPGYKKIHNLVEKAVPVLHYLEEVIKGHGSETKPQRIETRSVLGIQRYSDWIFSLSFPHLIQISPITLFELQHSLEPFTELSRDLLLEKVCYLTAAYYCISTETAFVSPSSPDSQKWLALSVQVAEDLLPQECPLLEHIQSSFSRLNPQKLTPAIKSSRKDLHHLSEKPGFMRSQILHRVSKTPERETLLRSLKITKSATAITSRERHSTVVKRRPASKSPISRRPLPAI